MSKEALVIGGTGSLGKALIPLLLKRGFGVSVLSREELKQKQLVSEFPAVKANLGDIRDYDSIAPHCLGKDVVFHLAAMKHVDMAEANIEESIKINLLGSLNVAKACLAGNVGYAALSSTDKAVLPINVYGMCKGLSEKLWQDYNKYQATSYSVFRWGNVLGSRGSVLHAFLKTLREEKCVYLTHPEMSRFWIHIDDVAKFMLDNYDELNGGVHIPPMKGAPVVRLATITAQYLGIRKYDVKTMPMRPGEKIHEWLDYHDDEFQLKSCDEQYSDEELFALVKRTLG